MKKHTLTQESLAIVKDKSSPTVICILGMHRSGTSCLAGSLQAAGLFSGEVEDWNIDNLKGNRENLEIMALNKAILKSENGSWDNPPTEVKWSQEHQDRRDDIIASFASEYDVWMFKEPRTLLTLPFWQAGISNLQFIGSFRNPVKVAMSLYQRSLGLITLRKGIDLWLHYNRILLEEWDKSPFPLICFDLSREEYLKQLESIISYLSKYKNLDIEEAKKFYEASLVHQKKIIASAEISQDGDKISDQQLLETAERLYQELKEAAGVSIEDISPQESAFIVPLAENTAAFEECIKIQPDNPHLYFMLGNTQFQEEDFAEAIASYRKAIELDSEYFWVYKKLAVTLTNSEKLQEAIGVYQELLKLQPDNPEIYYHLGNVYRKQGDLDTAINVYRKAINLNPKYLGSYISLANTLIQKNQPEEAIQVCHQAIDLKSEKSALYRVLGNAKLKAEDYEEASVSYHEAIDLEPENAANYRCLGNLQMRQKNLEGAKVNYEKAIELEPENFFNYKLLGNVFTKLKQFEEAVKEYEKAIELNSSRPLIYAALGNSQLQCGEFGRAATAYQKAIELNSKQPFGIYKNLGYCLSKQGQKEKAISAYKEALKLQPNNKFVSHNLEKIKVYTETLQHSELSKKIYDKLLAYTTAWQGKRVRQNSLIIGMNTTGTKQPLFWCLQGYRELSQLSKYLGKDQPTYGMRSGHLFMEYTPENIQALATHYVLEILAIQPDSPYLLGGNCQSALIIFEIAQQLISKGKTITLLFQMEQFVTQLYPGRVALIFGRESLFNPYKKFRSPELGYRKFYTGKFSVNIISGGHGQFFNEPNIQVLAETLTREIEKAKLESVSPQQEVKQSQLLPSQAYRAKITVEKTLRVIAGQSLIIPVRVKNTSTVTWKPTINSGIRLGNHWLDEQGEVVCWSDGIVKLNQEVSPGKVIRLDLFVNIPENPGKYQLELDLVEEGITWFKGKGSQSTVVDVTVQPLKNNSLMDVGESGFPLNHIGALALQKFGYLESKQLDCSKLNTGINLYSKNSDFYRQKGNSSFEKGDMESAIIDYQQAIKLNPNQSAEVYQKLGNAYSQQAKFSEAIVAYNKALDLDSNNASVYFLLGKVQVKQDKLIEATSSYKKAIELQPDSIWLYENLGEALHKLGQFEAAIKVYAKALEVDFNNFKIYAQLGNAQMKSGDCSGAITNYNKALELYPDSSGVYVALGNSQLKCRRIEQAITSYQKAIELNPNQPFGVYKNLGDCLSKQGHKEEAIAAYKEALKLQPNHQAVSQSLAKLKQQQN